MYLLLPTSQGKTSSGVCTFLSKYTHFLRFRPLCNKGKKERGKSKEIVGFSSLFPRFPLFPWHYTFFSLEPLFCYRSPLKLLMVRFELILASFSDF
jgi:hypothetical protein